MRTKQIPVTEVAGKYNILAYDLIYCAHAYNLYENIYRSKTEKIKCRRTKKTGKRK